FVIQAQGLAHDLRIAVEVRLPELVAQKHDMVIMSGLVFFRKKVASSHWSHAQHAEESRRNDCAFNLLRLAEACQVRGEAMKSSNALKCPIAPLYVPEIALAERGLVHLVRSARLPDLHQP